MKCRSCGYVSLEDRELCPRCGLAPGAAPVGERPSSTASPARTRARRRARSRTAAAAPAGEPAQLELVSDPTVPFAPPAAPVVPDGATEDLAAFAEFADDENLPDVDRTEEPATGAPGAGPANLLDDDLIPPALDPTPAGTAAARRPAGAPADRFRLPFEGRPAESGDGEPIIDRDEEVPEQYWAAEGAGLGRRALAVGIDALVCGGVLGIFAAAAWVALRAAGLEAGELLTSRVLAAAALPFALLALVVSLAYSVSFHVVAGATPGKRLARLEVRTVDGGRLSVGRSLARWCAALLAAAPAGAGILWALVDPRRRGWGDLLSGTVIAARRLPAGPDDSPGRR